MRKTYWILFWAGIIFFSGCDAQEQFLGTTKEKNPKLLAGCDLAVPSYSLRNLTGSTRFQLPANSVSFQLSAFNQSGANTRVFSLTNPRGDNLLNTAPLIGFRFVRQGYAGMVVPIVPGHTALSGEWNFVTAAAAGGTQVQLITRTGATPTKSTVVVQAYLSGSRYSSSEIQPALDIFKKIYENAGVNICLKPVKIISGSEFSSVSTNFTDSTTGKLISQGKAGEANIFFVEDFTGSNAGVLGISPGIPGSQGISGNWNGVLVGLAAHLAGGNLRNQLLGETTAHELGHWFGLFHTTERDGILFDPLSDTAECPSPGGGRLVFVGDCAGRGAANNMFWQGSAAVEQTTLTADQVYIINYSPIGR